MRAANPGKTSGSPPASTEDDDQAAAEDSNTADGSTTEAWFHADREELQSFYGNGFREGTERASGGRNDI